MGKSNMLEFIDLFFSTILFRPYVFIFLAFYLFAAYFQIGLTRLITFTILACSIAFISEYSSTRNGFPYGFYSYIQVTGDRELWVSNVPFMDSLSYSFLSYCSLSLAIFFKQNIARNKNNIYIVDFEKGLQDKTILCYGVVLFMLLDVIIDPVALRGSEWFLGQIYHYHSHGNYFGVPISNFAGWLIVGFCIISSFQFINKRFFKPPHNNIKVPYIDMLGPFLYFGVMVFNLAVAFYIEEYILGICGSLISGTILAIFLTKILKGRKLDEART